MPYVERVTPVILVKSIRKSLAFYKSVLGFEVEMGSEEESAICSIARDRQSTMLTEGSGLSPKSCVWIGLENDSLFGICKSKGVKVIQEPRNMPWAYEMKIEDEDGNVLWLGTEPKNDVAP